MMIIKQHIWRLHGASPFSTIPRRFTGHLRSTDCTVRGQKALQALQGQGGIPSGNP